MEGEPRRRADAYLKGGYGGLLGFELKGGKDAGRRFIDALKMFYHVANIGDARSLAIHPASTTHSQLTPEEQLQTGVTDGYVRLSLGIEHEDDIAADLHEDRFLDPAQGQQHRVAALFILDFQHHGGDQFLALRDQRIVGGQLVRDLRLAARLDVQHLLNLLPHRREILEIEGREWADLDAPLPLQLADLAAPLAPDLDVFVERQDVGAGQLAPGSGLLVVHALLAVCCEPSPARP